MSKATKEHPFLLAIFVAILSLAVFVLGAIIVPELQKLNSARLEYRVSGFCPIPERNPVSRLTAITVKNVGKKATTGHFAANSYINLGEFSKNILAKQGFKSTGVPRNNPTFEAIKVTGDFEEKDAGEKKLFKMSQVEPFTFAPDGEDSFLMVFEGEQGNYHLNEVNASLFFDVKDSSTPLTVLRTSEKQLDLSAIGIAIFGFLTLSASLCANAISMKRRILVSNSA